MADGRQKKDGEQLRTANLRFSSTTEFVERFLADVGIGGFQWEHSGVKMGEHFLFTVSFIGSTRHFELTGKVVWSNSSPPMKPELPVGVGIEFDPECKQTVHEIMHFAAYGDGRDALRAKDDRREVRFSVDLECEYLYRGKLTRALVGDLSRKGLFISTRQMLSHGDQFVFFLSDARQLRPLVLEGRVVHTKAEGAKRGFGVQLLFDSLKHKTEVQRYVEGLTEVLGEKEV